MSATKRGFTLVELLIAIAIIAILVAIIFPIFVMAREKARQSNCLSNIRQIVMSHTMYMSDYDGFTAPSYLPRTGGSYTCWFDILQPYLKNKKVFVCPENPISLPISVGNIGYGWNFYWLTLYGGNIFYGDIPTNSSRGIISRVYYGGNTANDAQLLSPADTIVIGDNSFELPYVIFPRYAGYYPKFRHGVGANFGFIDGHAKWIKRDEALSLAYWDTE